MRYLPLLLLLPLLLGATYTDTLTADFNLGATGQVNTTGDMITLNNASATEYNASGTYTSRVFDFGSNPTANISWGFSTPTSTSLLVSTRSGNNATDFSSWSSWSSDYSTSTGSLITSPTRRYYQYRAALAGNTSNTPQLTDVTLTYTEAGTSILAGTEYNLDLHSNYSGVYLFYVNVSDTLTIRNVTGRYRFDSGTWSTAVALTEAIPTIYNISVSVPTWSTVANTTLNVEVTVLTTNGSVNTTQTTTVQEVVQLTNSPPIIDPILNYTLAQDEQVNITVTGADSDNLTPAITFRTNRSDITVTTLTNTSARLTFTAGPEDVGFFAVNVTANDTINVSSRLFYFNVTEVEDAPTISSVSAITGYHGIRQTLVLTVIDTDANENITFTMDPLFFTITTSLTNGNTTANSTYYGIANFTPADPEHGVNNVTFFASDGTTTVNTSTTMTIDYCGDNVCQTTYENANTCVQDCAEDDTGDSIAIVLADRNCLNENMTITTFNATDRFLCYYEGRVRGTDALCAPLDGVSIAVYERNGSALISRATLTSADDGTATFVPTSAGEYKITAKKDGYANSTSLVYVRECNADISIPVKDVTVEQEPLPPLQERPKTEIPSEEEPGITQEEATLVQLVLFYFVVPLLLAMLLYASIVFYDVNKDTLPWLLEARIVVYEQRTKYKPQLDMIEAKVGPYLKPVVQSINQLYVVSLKPVVDKLKNTRKKP